jgi:hypothetical protein
VTYRRGEGIASGFIPKAAIQISMRSIEILAFDVVRLRACLISQSPKADDWTHFTNLDVRPRDGFVIPGASVVTIILAFTAIQ